MAENKSVFKGWLEKCKNVQSSQKGFQLLKGSVSWKKAFFILHSCQENSTLDCYEDEAQEDSVPKESLVLGPYYCVYKREGLLKNRRQVFDVTTPEATWRLAAADQTSLDLWVHYLQIQARLRDDLPGQYFAVRPGMSDSMKRIGAQGQQCLLHVSQWGITLAQEMSRCVLAQWPLKSLRNYGAEEDGKFGFEAGRQAPMGQGVYMFHVHQGLETTIDGLVDTFVQQQANRADQEATGRSPTKQETRGRRKGSGAHEPDPDLSAEYATLRMMTCAGVPLSPVDSRSQSSHLSFPRGTGLPIGSSVDQSQLSSSESSISIGQSNTVNVPPPFDGTNSTYLAMRSSFSPRSSTTSQSSSSEYEVMSPLSPDHFPPFQSLPSPPRRSGSFQDVTVFPMSPLSMKSGSFSDVSVFSQPSSPNDCISYAPNQPTSLGGDSTTQASSMHKRSASYTSETPEQNPFSLEQPQPATTSMNPGSATNATGRPLLHRSHSEGNIPPPFTNLASNSPPKLPPKVAGRALMSQRTLPPIPGSPLDANVASFQFTGGLRSPGSHEYQSLLTPAEVWRLREVEHSYSQVADRSRSNPEGQEQFVTSPHSAQATNTMGADRTRSNPEGQEQLVTSPYSPLAIGTMGAENTLEQGTQTSTKVKSPKSIKGLIFTKKTKTFVKRSQSSE